MSEEEIELMKQIDEQIEKNNKLKQEIKEIEAEINKHKASIDEAKETIDNLKRKGI